jgi:hypothetical protein
MSGIPWTKKEIEILKQMIATGCAVEEILKVLKSRTQGSIQAKAGDLGLSLAGTPEIDFDAFTKYIKQRKLKCL